MLVVIEWCPLHGLELHRDGVCDRCSNEAVAADFVQRYEDETDDRGPYDEVDEDW
jgi:hypothetical protein